MDDRNDVRCHIIWIVIALISMIEKKLAKISEELYDGGGKMQV